MGLIEYLPDDDGLLRRGGAAPATRRPLRRLLPEPPLQPAERERLHGAGARRGGPAAARRAARSPRAHGARRAARARGVARRVGRGARARGRRRPRRPAEGAARPPARVPARAGGSTRRATSRRLRSGTASARRELLALHPHPLPPALEPLAPRTYNRLADAWQRALERSPAGLAFSTAFVAVFERA